MYRGALRFGARSIAPVAPIVGPTAVDGGGSGIDIASDVKLDKVAGVVAGPDGASGCGAWRGVVTGEVAAAANEAKPDCRTGVPTSFAGRHIFTASSHLISSVASGKAICFRPRIFESHPPDFGVVGESGAANGAGAAEGCGGATGDMPSGTDAAARVGGVAVLSGEDNGDEDDERSEPKILILVGSQEPRDHPDDDWLRDRVQCFLSRSSKSLSACKNIGDISRACCLAAAVIDAMYRCAGSMRPISASIWAYSSLYGWNGGRENCELPDVRANS
jgi:hypothetical protein